MTYQSKRKGRGRLCCLNSLILNSPPCSRSNVRKSKAANKEIRMIRKVIRIIEIDQYYTGNVITNSSNISKSDINTYK